MLSSHFCKGNGEPDGFQYEHFCWRVHAPGESGTIKLDIGGGDLERAMEVTRADPDPDLERAQVECTAWTPQL